MRLASQAGTCANSTVSAHLFSLDGYEWHTTSTQPYGTTVPLSDGTNFTVATRERPKFFFKRLNYSNSLPYKNFCGTN